LIKTLNLFFDFLTFILSLEKNRKMKKVLMMVAAVAFLVACNGSKKGAWSDEDKQKAKDEVKKVEASLDVLGDKKQAYIDCYLDKIEDNYDNFDAANKDQKGCEKHAMDCVKDIYAVK
jgi:hypothetical protein